MSEATVSPLMFTVTEKPVHLLIGDGCVADNYHETPGWKQLVRRHPTTGEPYVLYVAKSTYTIVQNAELFKAADDAVASFAGDHMKDAIIQDKTSYLGAQCFRQYIFPTIRCELKQRRAGTSVMFRVIISTAFDGSAAIKVLSGAIDGFCSNGMIWGEYNQLIQKHTAGAKQLLPKLTDHLKASLAQFWVHADTLSVWAQKEISSEKALAFLKTQDYSNKRCNDIMVRFAIECEVRGPTLWALYSALTYYASHNSEEFGIRDTGKDNVAATLQKRELEVFRLTNSKEWKALAA